MYGIHQELAREHQAELLRGAERHRLARQARPRKERTGLLSALMIRVRRRRLRQPVPAV
jgi:hypothetical protein